MEAQALPRAEVGDAPSEEADALTEDDQLGRAVDQTSKLRGCRKSYRFQAGS